MYIAAAGELVLWGATLWDPRVPAPLHTFDQLSAGGAGGCFHPGGAEIILNSEVWDLRTRKLLRSVPLLDGTSVTFNSSE
jgi:HIV-1 Vpr-binding protein